MTNGETTDERDKSVASSTNVCGVLNGILAGHVGPIRILSLENGTARSAVVARKRMNPDWIGSNRFCCSEAFVRISMPARLQRDACARRAIR